ncbi:hypothetical protein Gotur_011649 [Gossypium turneri]
MLTKLQHKQINYAWKDIKEEFLKPTAAPTSALNRILNLAMVIDLLYTGEYAYMQVGDVLFYGALQSLGMCWSFRVVWCHWDCVCVCVHCRCVLVLVMLKVFEMDFVDGLKVFLVFLLLGYNGRFHYLHLNLVVATFY